MWIKEFEKEMSKITVSLSIFLLTGISRKRSTLISTLLGEKTVSVAPGQKCEKQKPNRKNNTYKFFDSNLGGCRKYLLSRCS